MLSCTQTRFKLPKELLNLEFMIGDDKKKIHEYLEHLPDKYVGEILEYLRFIEFKSKNEKADVSSMLLSERSLAKDWLTPEEDEAWKHL